jgi:hypothetical protein
MHIAYEYSFLTKSGVEFGFAGGFVSILKKSVSVWERKPVPSPNDLREKTFF